MTKLRNQSALIQTAEAGGCQPLVDGGREEVKSPASNGPIRETVELLGYSYKLSRLAGGEGVELYFGGNRGRW